jgi:hypothetical protein
MFYKVLKMKEIVGENLFEASWFVVYNNKKPL